MPPITGEAPRLTPKRSNVLFLRGEWLDAAVVTTPGASEAGTAVTDLQRVQPAEFWGQASPARFEADRGERAPIGAVAMPYAFVPLGTTWRVRLGDSVEERDGTRLRDASGHANHGLFINGAACGPGLFGGGLVLDASGTQYVESTGLFDGPVGGAIELVGRFPRRAQWLFWHAAGAGLPRGIYHDADGIVHVYRGSGAGPLLSSSVPIPDPAAWCRIAYRFDDQITGDCSLLLDGETVASGSDISDPPTGELQLGNGDAAIAPIAAETVLDEIRYWAIDRTVAEIQEAATRELSSAEAASCIAYYRCNAFDSGELPFPAPGVIDWTVLPDPRCHALLFLEQAWVWRHLRVDITAPTPGTLLRFGRALAGEVIQPSNWSASFGRTYGRVDESKFDRGPGALLVVDPAADYPVTEFTIENIPQRELWATFLRLQQLLAGGRPALVCLNPADAEFMQHKIYYGPLKFELFTERDWDWHVIRVRVEGMP